MAWKKGQSGNPGGRTNERAFADAVRIACNEQDEASGKKRLRRIAERLVEEAVKGEAWAIQQVADRLDGKPAQESTLKIEDKRDASDWTRDELVAFLNDTKAGGNGAAAPNGSDGKPDSVH